MIAVAAIVLSDLFAVVMLFGIYSLLTAAEEDVRNAGLRMQGKRLTWQNG